MDVPTNRILNGNCLEIMQGFPEQSIDLVMFSPPYWGKRDYGESTDLVWGGDAWRGQFGLEPTPELYIDHLAEICQAVKRVLKNQGSFYLNIDDTYMSSTITIKRKSLIGVPWRVAIHLIDSHGWILRNAIVWHKPNHMPEGVKDRLTRSYEHIFHFVKQPKYYYNMDEIRVPHKAGVTRWGGQTMRVPKQEKKKQGLAKALLTKDRPWRNPKGKNPGDVLTYDSKYAKTDYGQTLQGFIRNQSTAIGRLQSRIDAKRVFPNNPKKQQEYINFVHDYTGHPKGKNPGDYWSINTKPFKGAHFAVYPEAICEQPIKSSCPPNGIVLDPLCGSGTTLVVAHKLGRKWIGIELNPEYAEIARNRLSKLSEKLGIWF